MKLESTNISTFEMDLSEAFNNVEHVAVYKSMNVAIKIANNQKVKDTIDKLY